MSSSWLERLSLAALRRPRRVLLLALLALVGSGLALSRLTFLTDVTQLLHTPAAHTLQQAGEVFGLNERAYLLIEAERAGREDDLLRFADQLEQRLLQEGLAATAEHGLPWRPEEIAERLLLPYSPLYFPLAEQPTLSRLLSEEGLKIQLEKQLDRLTLMGLGQAEEWLERDPLELHRPLLRRVRSLEGDYRFAPDSQHYLNPEGSALLIRLSASARADSMSGARRTVAGIQAAADELLRQPWAAGLAVFPTGGHFLAEEGERVVRRDLTWGFSASILLALCLIAYGLRLSPPVVLLLFLPTLWAIVVGAGVFAVLRPSLAILSLGCTSILFGLGVDFTIHLTAAARAGQGDDPTQEALRSTSGALVLAAFTSAAAFVAFLSSGQSFLQELGLLTALGLLASLVGALFLLPALLARWARAGAGPASSRDLGGVWLSRQASRRPLLALSLMGALSLAALGLLAWRPPQLEDDLRRIHARDSRPLANQERISDTFGGSQEPLTVLLEGRDEAEVLAACYRLEEELTPLLQAGQLVSWISPAAILPEPAAQERCRELLAEIGPERLRGRFERALEATGFDPAAFSDYAQGLANATRLSAPLTALDLERLQVGNLVRGLLREHAGRTYALVLVYPARELWAGAPRERLVKQLESALRLARVSGGLTGLYVVSAEAAQQVAGDFRRIALFTLGAVLLVLACRFRHPGQLLLALAPAALGALWTAGLYSLWDLRLNLMNLGVVPMVLAIGIDDGIHLMHRFVRGEASPDKASYQGTVAAIVLTSLTTMVAFGGLALSRNQGIASVGVLSLVGVGGCLLASLTVLPAAFRLLENIPAAGTSKGRRDQ